ncbi:hypothetical protein Pan14r_52380 [Crateriforma conspicua]|uniref:Uncharacterized protein n=1 Tax=Crateriforma conspicua TaxID=2527996 RepID=A0A5C5XSV7_9PLAN|nr:hypothetical protein Pan14r_52380 [Crateriforma conspicua]
MNGQRIGVDGFDSPKEEFGFPQTTRSPPLKRRRRTRYHPMSPKANSTMETMPTYVRV